MASRLLLHEPMVRFALLALLTGCSGEALALAYVAQGAYQIHDMTAGDAPEADRPSEDPEFRVRYKHAITPCTKGDADACLTVALYLDNHEQNADGTIAAYEYACANGKSFACERLTSDTWFSTRRTAFRR